MACGLEIKMRGLVNRDAVEPRGGQAGDERPLGHRWRRKQTQRFGLRFQKRISDFSSRVKGAFLKTLYRTICHSVSELRFLDCAHAHTAQTLRPPLLLRTDRFESLRPAPGRTPPRGCGRCNPCLPISSRRLPPLNRRQIRTGKISDTAISSPAPPPLGRIAHGIRLA